jgi:ribonuclease BN (tRNA processing enzyme)
MNNVTRWKHEYSRRELLKDIAALAGAGVPMLGFGGTKLTALAQAPAGGRGARGIRGVATSAPAGTTLILLGTQGGPNVSLSRSQTASVVMAGGRPYLVDCGYGAVRGLVQAGLRIADISNVFVSHLHNDHTADIAALLSLKWTGGQANPQPVGVWGPPGSKGMVEGAIAFFRGDNEIRTVDEGRTVKAESIFNGHDLSAPKITEVFKDERVTVQAVENTHFSDRAKEKMAHRSFAYRFNTADRSIVLSGDTAYSSGLIELARGADVLVCEAMTMTMRRQLEGTNRGNTNTESIGRHVLETHASTEEVGRMAAEAKVKTVVLYHLVGFPADQSGGSPDDAFIPDVKKNFSGEVIVGADQMRI